MPRQSALAGPRQSTAPSIRPRWARRTNFPSSRRSTTNGRRHASHGVTSFRRNIPLGGTRATVSPPQYGQRVSQRMHARIRMPSDSRDTTRS